MDVKKRVTYEADCEFAVYGDTYTRFFVDGDFHTVPNNVEGAEEEKGPRVVAEYEVAVYGGTYARFLINGAFRRVPENVEEIAKEKGLRVAVERFPDGLVALHAQRLVPWDTEKSDLNVLFELQLEQFEKELGAKGRQFFSSGWSIGRDSTEYDHLLTDAERQLLDQ